MNKLKLFGMTGLAVAAIGVGGLVAPPASAERRSPFIERGPVQSCALAVRLARVYTAHGNVFSGVGNRERADFYYHLADFYSTAPCYLP